MSTKHCQRLQAIALSGTFILSCLTSGCSGPPPRKQAPGISAPVVAVPEPQAYAEPDMRAAHFFGESEGPIKEYIRTLGKRAKVVIEHSSYDSGSLELTKATHPTIDAEIDKTFGMLDVWISSSGFRLPEGLTIGQSSLADVVKTLGFDRDHPAGTPRLYDNSPQLRYVIEGACDSVLTFNFNEREIMRNVKFDGCVP